MMNSPMRTLVTRLMTALSLLALLFVAVLVVRVQTWTSERALVSTSLPDTFFVPSASTAKQPSLDNVYASVVVPDFEMPIVNRIARSSANKQPRVRFMQVTKEVNILDEVFAPVQNAPVQDVDGQWRQLQGSTTVPTAEPVVLKPVEMKSELSTQFVALMDNVVLPNEEKTEIAEAPAPVVPAEEVPVSPVVDSVNTIAAKDAVVSDDDLEPQFFEMPKKAEQSKDLVVKAQPVAEEVVGAKDDYPEPVGWDLPVGSQNAPPDQTIKVDSQLVTAGFVAPQGVPTSVLKPAPVVAMTTHSQAPVSSNSEYSAPVITDTQKKEKTVDVPDSQEEVATQPSRITIAPLAVGAGKSVSALKNFEIRPKDDDAESWQDAGKGEVVWEEQVAEGTYSRGIVILQDDYVPTHADIAMAPEQEGIINIPVFSTEKMARFGEVTGTKPTGSVLVELDEATETIQLDGLKSKTFRLTADFTITKGDDFQYLLFNGVEAGNRTMTMVLSNGRRVHRLIHVHEREMTFDSNLYGKEERVVVALAEEDLLSRKKRPLVIPGEKTQDFFTGEKAQKLSPSKYAFRSSVRAQGARRYVALGHQGEEIYVGFDGSKTVEVPSEALMREVIQRFHLNGSSKSCVVQVNLDRAAKRYMVQSESYGEGHVSYGQVLDEDGQFYESMGENSRRLFLMSENTSGSSHSDNARLNIRIEYQDGSHRSFQSYCSPNSYLVEQL